MNQSSTVSFVSYLTNVKSAKKVIRMIKELVRRFVVLLVIWFVQTCKNVMKKLLDVWINVLKVVCR